MGARRYRLLLVVGLVLSGCAKYEAVSPSDTSRLEPRAGDKYRVTTKDGMAFTTTSFAVEDSVLVVREVRPRNSYEYETIPAVPFAVPLTQVDHIDRVTTDTTRSLLVLVAVTSLFAGALYWLFSNLPY